MLDLRELAHPRVGLAQIKPRLLRQSHQLLTGPVEQLGIGGEHHVLRLYCRIDDYAACVLVWNIVCNNLSTFSTQAIILNINYLSASEFTSGDDESLGPYFISSRLRDAGRHD